ncbi:unnamed protein product [Aphanomyces euteiches]
MDIEKTLIAAVLTAILALVIQYILRRKTSGAIPTVPSWIPFLGSSLDFSSDPVGFIRSCSARYGSIFNVYLGGKTMTFFISPKHYATLLKHRSLSHKPAFFNVATKALGESTSFNNDVMSLHPSEAAEEYHKLVVTHLLGTSAVKTLVENTFHQQRRILATFDRVGRQSLLDFVQRGIFNSGSRVLLGDSLVDKSPNLLADFDAFDKSFPLLVAGVPQVFLRSAVQAREGVVQAIDKNLGDDASTIIQKRNEAIQKIASVQPLDPARDIMALLWAGSANSIPTAYWALFYLLRDKAAWRAVFDEVHEHLPKGGAEVWTPEQLSKCVLLASAVDEALRLSASSILMREAMEDIDLKTMDPPVYLAKGSNVIIYPSLGHFDEEIFPSPKTFKYDRFVNATREQLEAFKPFGMGATMCPGRNFAKNQIKMFIALIMQETKRIELVPGYGEPKNDPSRLGLGKDHKLKTR